jgi:hypothetical protein
MSTLSISMTESEVDEAREVLAEESAANHITAR